MDQETMTRAACAATSEVFMTMLNLEAVPEQVYTDEGSPAAANGIVALIGMAGAWVGTGVVVCSPEFACKLASIMLMTEYQSVDGDVLDAVAEIGNMIIGNVKTALEEEVGALGLSVPTVVYGRNYFVKNVGPQSWTVVPFRIDSEQLIVKLCLSPNAGSASPVKPGYLRTYSVQD